jgi:hypothetical protein
MSFLPSAPGFRHPRDVLEVGAATVNGDRSHADPRAGLRSAFQRRAREPRRAWRARSRSRSRAFYAECLGLLVSDETRDALYLRGVEERNHHSIVLRRSREADVRALGFKLASEEDIDRAASWFGRRNLPTSFPDLPHRGRTLRTADVFGMPLDLYAQMDRVRKHASAIQPRTRCAHPAHRSSQLLHARCAGELRLLS